MREDIATFDARNIPKEIRESVEELLFKNKGSFDPKVILTDTLNSLSILLLYSSCQNVMVYIICFLVYLKKLVFYNKL